MNELYNRQSELPLYVPPKIAVIGLGGGGSWVALSFALMGTTEIVVVDNDTIELSNLNRTMYRQSDIGKLKTTAIKELIAERRPECKVNCINVTSLKAYDDLNAGLSMEFLDVLDGCPVIDATDNYQTRDLFTHLFLKENVRPIYCKLGYDGKSYELDFSFQHIEDSAQRGYRKINTYVGTVMSEVAELLHLMSGHDYMTATERNLFYSRDCSIGEHTIVKEPIPKPNVKILDEARIQIDNKIYAIRQNHTEDDAPVYFNVDYNAREQSYTARYYGWVSQLDWLCGTIINRYSKRSSRITTPEGLQVSTADCIFLGDVLETLNAETPVTENHSLKFDYEVVEEDADVQMDTEVVVLGQASLTEN